MRQGSVGLQVLYDPNRLKCLLGGRTGERNWHGPQVEGDSLGGSPG